MKPKFYEVLDLAIEQGVAQGLRRAWKHRSDGPTEEVLAEVKECVHSAVLDALHEWFDINRPSEWEEEE